MFRYWQDRRSLPMKRPDQNEQQIAFAHSNLRLMFDDELRDGYSSIKIAELQRPLPDNSPSMRITFRRP